MNVFFFGPGGIPLVIPNIVMKDEAIIKSVFKLDSYGICIEGVDNNLQDEKTVKADVTFKLKINNSVQYRELGGGTLFMFVLIDNMASHNTVSCSDLLFTVRQKFSKLLMIHNMKFKKAVQTSLNKVLNNLEAMKEIQESVDKSVPKIVDAISTILTLSTNEDFRQKAFNIMKVPDKQALKASLKSSLWEIALQTCKYNITQPEQSETMGQPMTSLSQCSTVTSQESSNCSSQTIYSEPPSQNSPEELYTLADIGTSLIDSRSTFEAHDDGSFDSLASTCIRDELSMFQDDLGGIENIDAFDQQFEQRLQHENMMSTETCTGLQNNLEDEWFSDVLFDDIDKI